MSSSMQGVWHMVHTFGARDVLCQLTVGYNVRGLMLDMVCTGISWYAIARFDCLQVYVST